MRILIAYAGKTGTTERCAGLLAQRLEGADVADLTRETPDAGSYDVVVVGGSIRAGMLHGAAKKYIKQNAELLKGKEAAYFVCSCDPERPREMLVANIGEELVDKAVCIDSFGGVIDISKQKGLGKLFVKIMLKGEASAGPGILEDRIDAFARKLTGFRKEA